MFTCTRGDDHRSIHGVESICRTLQIAPSGYYARLAVRADPSKASARQQRDAVLRPKIKKVWNDNWQVYEVRKTWRQLCREGEAAARCTPHGWHGIARNCSRKGSENNDPGYFRAVSTRQGEPEIPGASAKYVMGQRLHLRLNMAGFVYVAFVIDTFANRIVGWKASRSAKTDFVLDVLEQALYARRPAHQGGLIHHSDRGSQHVSIRYTERLGKAGIEPSVGSVGDAYDNALAETINGLYKTEVIRRCSSWKTTEEVELETLKWPYSIAYRLTSRLV